MQHASLHDCSSTAGQKPLWNALSDKSSLDSTNWQPLLFLQITLLQTCKCRMKPGKPKLQDYFLCSSLPLIYRDLSKVTSFLHASSYLLYNSSNSKSCSDNNKLVLYKYINIYRTPLQHLSFSDHIVLSTAVLLWTTYLQLIFTTNDPQTLFLPQGLIALSSKNSVSSHLYSIQLTEFLLISKYDRIYLVQDCNTECSFCALDRPVLVGFNRTEAFSLCDCKGLSFKNRLAGSNRILQHLPEQCLFP